MRRRARSLRKRATLAERVFLEEARRYADPVEFQVPMLGRYVVDFVFPTRRLVVEIDGAYHEEQVQRWLDGNRTADIEALGFRLRRFTNAETISNPREVYRRALAEMPTVRPLPTRHAHKDSRGRWR